jgi:uncharacterized membrane protein
MRRALRIVLAVSMMAIGVLHFVAPDGFVKIVPRFLPAPLVLVLVSGAFEILGGVGLLVARVRRAASFGLVALYVAVFPANVNMAVNDLRRLLGRGLLGIRLHDERQGVAVVAHLALERLMGRAGHGAGPAGIDNRGVCRGDALNARHLLLRLGRTAAQGDQRRQQS